MNIQSKCAQRILSLVDEGSFYEIDAFSSNENSLSEAVCGHGQVNGKPVYVFSRNAEVNGGAMCRSQADKLCKLYDLASKTGCPVVAIYDSFGGQINEGLFCLDAYGEVLAKINNISGVVPQISVVAGKCVGCAAMLAVSADVVIKTDSAEIYMTPGDEIEDAEKTNTAQICVSTDAEAMQAVKDLISALPLNNLDVPSAFLPAESETHPDFSFGECIVDAGGKIELSPNFGKGVKTFFARLNGVSVGVLDYCSKDKIISADDCTKAARFVRLCDGFSIPLISFVDAKRFGDSKLSQVRSAAMLAHAYAEATSVKISVVYGYACGAVFSAISSRKGCADSVIALNDSKISVTAPEVAAMVLLSDKRDEGTSLTELAAAYEKENCSPLIAAKDGFVDDVVSKTELRGRLITVLEMLSGKRVSGLDKKHSNMPL